MKKFSVSAILAMGVLTVSSGAFAGTTSSLYRGLVTVEVADTVVPK
ncbi:secreted protein, partial [gut metagenome]